MTEHELASYIQQAMTAAGAEYAGLPLFLVSGENYYVRHGVPSDRVIQNGDVIGCEITGVHCRYAGPLFRTFYLGEPPKELVEHSAVATEMINTLIDVLRPGITSGEIEEIILNVAKKAGLEDGVSSRTGYSVGLNFPPDWGEGYFLDLNAGDKTVIEPGMVFHAPQVIRYRDCLPTSVSETLFVTGSGCKVLSKFEPRGLVVL
jgi:Xaa-Pro dipeptidase